MSNNETVLLVDDEPALLESCRRILESEFKCVTTTNPNDVMALVREHNPSVVVTDYLMPGKNGVELLNEVSAEFPDIPVVMISAYATVEGVVDAVKKGAFDYLTKPFSADQLLITVRRSVERLRLARENAGLKEKIQDDFFNRDFVGKHPKFLKVVETIKKIADTESNVLIEGETGTGKELAARAIHLKSKRGEGPFVAIDCETLTERMLGASAGAETTGKNILESVNGGTIYLKQIESLDMGSQARLLGVLQEGKVRLGDELKWASFNARVITSTSSDLRIAVDEKKLRENLYYCINVINISIPPLRERLEDIGILADNFIKIRAACNSRVMTLSSGALGRLMEYNWPGNVRELKNVIDSAISLAEGDTLLIKHLPEKVINANRTFSLSFKEAKQKWMKGFEKTYLENLLLKNNGNITRASEDSGITRMSLYRMLKRTGLANRQSLFKRPVSGKSDRKTGDRPGK